MLSFKKIAGFLKRVGSRDGGNRDDPANKHQQQQSPQQGQQGAGMGANGESMAGNLTVSASAATAGTAATPILQGLPPSADTQAVLRHVQSVVIKKSQYALDDSSWLLFALSPAPASSGGGNISIAAEIDDVSPFPGTLDGASSGGENVGHGNQAVAAALNRHQRPSRKSPPVAQSQSPSKQASLSQGKPQPQPQPLRPLSSHSAGGPTTPSSSSRSRTPNHSSAHRFISAGREASVEQVERVDQASPDAGNEEFNRTPEDSSSAAGGRADEIDLTLGNENGDVSASGSHTASRTRRSPLLHPHQPQRQSSALSSPGVTNVVRLAHGPDGSEDHHTSHQQQQEQQDASKQCVTGNVNGNSVSRLFPSTVATHNTAISANGLAPSPDGGLLTSLQRERAEMIEALDVCLQEVPEYTSELDLVQHIADTIAAEHQRQAQLQSQLQAYRRRTLQQPSSLNAEKGSATAGGCITNTVDALARNGYGEERGYTVDDSTRDSNANEPDQDDEDAGGDGEGDAAGGSVPSSRQPRTPLRATRVRQQQQQRSSSLPAGIAAQISSSGVGQDEDFDMAEDDPDVDENRSYVVDMDFEDDNESSAVFSLSGPMTAGRLGVGGGCSGLRSGLAPPVINRNYIMHRADATGYSGGIGASGVTSFTIYEWRQLLLQIVDLLIGIDRAMYIELGQQASNCGGRRNATLRRQLEREASALAAAAAAAAAAAGNGAVGAAAAHTSPGKLPRPTLHPSPLEGAQEASIRASATGASNAAASASVLGPTPVASAEPADVPLTPPHRPPRAMGSTAHSAPATPGAQALPSVAGPADSDAGNAAATSVGAAGVPSTPSPPSIAAARAAATVTPTPLEMKERKALAHTATRAVDDALGAACTLATWVTLRALLRQHLHHLETAAAQYADEEAAITAAATAAATASAIASVGPTTVGEARVVSRSECTADVSGAAEGRAASSDVDKESAVYFQGQARITAMDDGDSQVAPTGAADGGGGAAVMAASALNATLKSAATTTTTNWTTYSSVPPALQLASLQPQLQAAAHATLAATNFPTLRVEWTGVVAELQELLGLPSPHMAACVMCASFLRDDGRELLLCMLQDPKPHSVMERAYSNQRSIFQQSTIDFLAHAGGAPPLASASASANAAANGNSNATLATGGGNGGTSGGTNATATAAAAATATASKAAGSVSVSSTAGTTPGASPTVSASVSSSTAAGNSSSNSSNSSSSTSANPTAQHSPILAVAHAGSLPPRLSTLSLSASGKSVTTTNGGDKAADPNVVPTLSNRSTYSTDVVLDDILHDLERAYHDGIARTWSAYLEGTIMAPFMASIKGETGSNVTAARPAVGTGDDATADGTSDHIEAEEEEHENENDYGDASKSRRPPLSREVSTTPTQQQQQQQQDPDLDRSRHLVDSLSAMLASSEGDAVLCQVATAYFFCSDDWDRLDKRNGFDLMYHHARNRVFMSKEREEWATGKRYAAVVTALENAAVAQVREDYHPTPQHTSGAAAIAAGLTSPHAYITGGRGAAATTTHPAAAGSVRASPGDLGLLSPPAPLTPDTTYLGVTGESAQLSSSNNLPAVSTAGGQQLAHTGLTTNGAASLNTTCTAYGHSSDYGGDSTFGSVRWSPFLFPGAGGVGGSPQQLQVAGTPGIALSAMASTPIALGSSGMSESVCPGGGSTQQLQQLITSRRPPAALSVLQGGADAGANVNSTSTTSVVHLVPPVVSLIMEHHQHLMNVIATLGEFSVEHEMIERMLNMSWSAAIHKRIEHCLSARPPLLERSLALAQEERSVANVFTDFRARQRALGSLVNVHLASGKSQEAYAVASKHFKNEKKEWTTHTQTMFTATRYMQSMVQLVRAQAACHAHGAVTETGQFVLPQAALCEQMLHVLAPRPRGAFVLRYGDTRLKLLKAKIYLKRELWRSYAAFDDTARSQRFFFETIQDICLLRRRKRAAALFDALMERGAQQMHKQLYASSVELFKLAVQLAKVAMEHAMAKPSMAITTATIKGSAPAGGKSSGSATAATSTAGATVITNANTGPMAPLPSAPVPATNTTASSSPLPSATTTTTTTTTTANRTPTAFHKGLHLRGAGSGSLTSAEEHSGGGSQREVDDMELPWRVAESERMLALAFVMQAEHEVNVPERRKQLSNAVNNAYASQSSLQRWQAKGGTPKRMLTAVPLSLVVVCRALLLLKQPKKAALLLEPLIEDKLNSAQVRPPMWKEILNPTADPLTAEDVVLRAYVNSVRLSVCLLYVQSLSRFDGERTLRAVDLVRNLLNESEQWVRMVQTQVRSAGGQATKSRTSVCLDFSSAGIANANRMQEHPPISGGTRAAIATRSGAAGVPNATSPHTFPDTPTPAEVPRTCVEGPDGTCVDTRANDGVRHGSPFLHRVSCGGAGTFNVSTTTVPPLSVTGFEEEPKPAMARAATLVPQGSTMSTNARHGGESSANAPVGIHVIMESHSERVTAWRALWHHVSDIRKTARDVEIAAGDALGLLGRWEDALEAYSRALVICMSEEEAAHERQRAAANPATPAAAASHPTSRRATIGAVHNATINTSSTSGVAMARSNSLSYTLPQHQQQHQGSVGVQVLAHDDAGEPARAHEETADDAGGKAENVEEELDSAIADVHVPASTTVLSDLRAVAAAEVRRDYKAAENRVLSKLAEVYRALDKPKMSIHYLHLVLEYAMKSNDALLEYTSTLQLARLYTSVEASDEAQSMWERVSTLAKQYDDQEVSRETTRNLVSGQLAAGMFPAVVETATELNTLASGDEGSDAAADKRFALEALAEAHLQLAHFKECLEALDAREKVQERSGEWNGKLLELRARAKLGMGESAEALKVLLSWVSKARQMRSPVELARSNVVLAVAYASEGSVYRARRCHLAALHALAGVRTQLSKEGKETVLASARWLVHDYYLNEERVQVDPSLKDTPPAGAHYGKGGRGLSGHSAFMNKGSSSFAHDLHNNSGDLAAILEDDERMRKERAAAGSDDGSNELDDMSFVSGTSFAGLDMNAILDCGGDGELPATLSATANDADASAAKIATAENETESLEPRVSEEKKTSDDSDEDTPLHRDGEDISEHAASDSKPCTALFSAKAATSAAASSGRPAVPASTLANVSMCSRPAAAATGTDILESLPLPDYTIAHRGAGSGTSVGLDDGKGRASAATGAALPALSLPDELHYQSPATVGTLCYTSAIETMEWTTMLLAQCEVAMLYQHSQQGQQQLPQQQQQGTASSHNTSGNPSAVGAHGGASSPAAAAAAAAATREVAVASELLLPNIIPYSPAEAVDFALLAFPRCTFVLYFAEFAMTSSSCYDIVIRPANRGFFIHRSAQVTTLKDYHDKNVLARVAAGPAAGKKANNRSSNSGATSQNSLNMTVELPAATSGMASHLDENPMFAGGANGVSHHPFGVHAAHGGDQKQEGATNTLTGEELARALDHDTTQRLYDLYDELWTPVVSGMRRAKLTLEDAECLFIVADPTLMHAPFSGLSPNAEHCMPGECQEPLGARMTMAVVPALSHLVYRGLTRSSERRRTAFTLPSDKGNGPQRYADRGTSQKASVGRAHNYPSHNRRRRSSAISNGHGDNGGDARSRSRRLSEQVFSTPAGRAVPVKPHVVNAVFLPDDDIAAAAFHAQQQKRKLTLQHQQHQQPGGRILSLSATLTTTDRDTTSGGGGGAGGTPADGATVSHPPAPPASPISPHNETGNAKGYTEAIEDPFFELVYGSGGVTTLAAASAVDAAAIDMDDDGEMQFDSENENGYEYCASDSSGSDSDSDSNNSDSCNSSVMGPGRGAHGDAAASETISDVDSPTRQPTTGAASRRATDPATAISRTGAAERVHADLGLPPLPSPTETTSNRLGSHRHHHRHRYSERGDQRQEQQPKSAGGSGAEWIRGFGDAEWALHGGCTRKQLVRAFCDPLSRIVMVLTTPVDSMIRAVDGFVSLHDLLTCHSVHPTHGSTAAATGVAASAGSGSPLPSPARNAANGAYNRTGEGATSDALSGPPSSAASPRRDVHSFGTHSLSFPVASSHTAPVVRVPSLHQLDLLILVTDRGQIPVSTELVTAARACLQFGCPRVLRVDVVSGGIISTEQKAFIVLYLHNVERLRRWSMALPYALALRMTIETARNEKGWPSTVWGSFHLLGAP